ncbi:MAG: hypothetical protein R3Y32_09250 [Bacillota bacterium]
MKNRVLRSALAVILVIAMVLTMAACNTETVDPTVAPVVTAAPTVAPATETPATDAPATEAPTVVVDSTEAKLAEYGITFPDFDSLVYDVYDSGYDKDNMTFGVKIDSDNIYQDAYEFSIKAVLVGQTIDGDSISSSNLLNTAASDNDSKTVNWNGSDSKIYYTVAGAGVYTVTYTIEVEHDKDDEYGYYAPGEVEEEYTFTKTYTVAKAALKLETSDDAYQINDDMFFVDKSVTNNGVLEGASDDDYSATTNVTICDGTVAGAYTLAITIYNDDDEEVEADEIVLDNYYVTVTEGTRYILTEEEVAKVNALRQMAAADAGVYTTEYSVETIAYYETLNDGQKVMAEVEYSTNWADRADVKLYTSSNVVSYYLTTTKAVTEDDIEKAIYNMERDDLIDQVEDAIEAYMTASTTTKKDAALTVLCELLLNIDNTANEYGSDLLYVLTSLDGLSAYSNATFSTKAMDSANNDTTDFTDNEANTYYKIVSSGYTTNENLIKFTASYDTDDETYEVSFGYYNEDVAAAASKFVVNAVYDEYVTEYVKYLVELFYGTDGTDGSYFTVVDTQAIKQDDIDDLQDDYDDLIEAYESLISYQADLEIYGSATDLCDIQTTAAQKLSGISFLASQDLDDGYADACQAIDKIIARWDAYIALIEAYGFEETYINNADQEDLAATYMAMYALLGYSFDNEELASAVVPNGDPTDTDYEYSYVTISNGGAVYAVYYDTGGWYYDTTGGTKTYVSNNGTVTHVNNISETLSNALFAYTNVVTGEVVYNTPDLFVAGEIAATETMMQIALAVQAEVDAYKIDLLQYVISTDEYTDIYNEIESSGTYYEEIMDVLLGTTVIDTTNKTIVPYDVAAYATAGTLNGTSWATLAEFVTDDTYGTESDNVSTQVAANLADVYAYIDAYVAYQALDDGSTFWKQVEKNGLDAAIADMFEDIIEDTQDRIDAICDDKEDLSNVVTITAMTTASESVVGGVEVAIGSDDLAATNYTVAYSIASSNTRLVFTENNTTAGTYSFTGTLVADDTITVSATVTYTGAYAYLGTETISKVITVSADVAG